MGEMKNAYNILVKKKPERKKPLRSFVDNIKMDIRETDWTLWIGFN
jgi:hypothetical protein